MGFLNIVKFLPVIGQIFELGFAIRDKVQAGKRERAERRAIEKCGLNEKLTRDILARAEARRTKP